MGRRSRGGLTKEQYRAKRQELATAHAQPPLTRAENERRAARARLELLALPKPEHNTTHGTHTGPKTAPQERPRKQLGQFELPAYRREVVTERTPPTPEEAAAVQAAGGEHGGSVHICEEWRPIPAAVVGAAVVAVSADLKQPEKIERERSDGASVSGTRPPALVHGKGKRFERRTSYTRRPKIRGR